jgi:hypothetical protein
MSFSGDLPAEGSGLDYSDIGASQRSGAVQLPFMESLADTASHALFSGVRGVLDYTAMDAARQQTIRDQQFNVDPTQDPGGALIDPKEWQTKYPDLGLTFTPDMGQAQAQLLVDHRQDELRRQYVLDHSPNTFMAKTARGLTDFAVSALDPLNIAAAFVPGLGETRAGLIAARYGKTAARLAEGAAAGATGMAALQPIQYAEAQAYEDHYGPMDAFLNVAFGAALGGGLHAGFGKISDFFDRAHPETQEAALRSSVGQMAEGRPVDVEPVLATDPGIVEQRIGTAEPGPIDSFPVINQEDLTLAGRQAQLQQDVASHEAALTELKAKVDALPAEKPESVARLRDLQDTEGKMLSEDLTPEGRRALAQRRDEILTNTNPETLKAEAQPTVDRQALAEQDRGLRAQRDNAASMLEEIKSQRRQIQVLNALGPYARSAIDRARENSVSFSKGQERSTVAMPAEESARAAETVRAGQDPATELADAEARLAAYKEQGIVSDEEHTAFNDAAKADAEALDTRSKAAEVAARCLYLHP